MLPSTNPTKPVLSRRNVLKVGAGAAATAIAIPTLSGTAAAHFPDTLEIDVKPGSDENPINPRSRGVVPVAVLYTEFEDGDENEVVFDPTERAIRYRFGAPDVVADGDGARPAHEGHVRDVNGDGHDDLVLHFPIRDTGLGGEATSAELRWERDETGEHGWSGSAPVTIVGRR